jgi:hypothetical protein
VAIKKELKLKSWQGREWRSINERKLFNFPPIFYGDEMTSSGCPYCGTAIDTIATACPYCKKELPEAVIDFIKNEKDNAKSKIATKAGSQVFLEYFLGVFFIILSAIIFSIINPGSLARQAGGLMGQSVVVLLYTVVYVKWGFGKSLPSIKFFPRDNGFLVFSEILLIHELIFLYRAMT